MSDVKLTILATALRTLQLEQSALKQLEQSIDSIFFDCIQAIYKINGRVIVSGIGKSAIIAQKIVATLNSTGTPAIFMHAAEAVHGDLGMIQKEDFVLLISKSGETSEIRTLLPLIKQKGNLIAAIVSKLSSPLARAADYVLHAPVEREACPHNLAPTVSTTVQLALGDALAMALLEWRGFSEAEFAHLHPGGNLGKRLNLKVVDLLNDTRNSPQVLGEANISQIIYEISSKRMGATAVVDTTQVLLGIITDGDLRRMLEMGEILSPIRAKDIMTANPQVIAKDVLAKDALHFMNEKLITQLLVVEGEKYVGMIHLHDLLREGL